MLRLKTVLILCAASDARLLGPVPSDGVHLRSSVSSCPRWRLARIRRAVEMNDSPQRQAPMLLPLYSQGSVGFCFV